MKLCVVGGGIAGTAAAWAAARAGATVELFHGRAGASALYSGALDLVEGPPRAAERLDAEVVAFAAALGIWQIPAQLSRIVTLAGRVRATRGRDIALLDLEPLAGRRIAVADVERDDWDAPLLAQALSATRFAERTKARFEPVRVAALQSGFERRITAYDFAKLHDAPDRLDALAKALDSVARGYDAVLVGPWLGLVPETPETLRSKLHLPVGEPTSPPGGPAGARFDNARDRLLEELTVRVHQSAVASVRASGTAFSVELAASQAESITADAVLLALGGVAAGGVQLIEPRPRGGGRGFVLSLDAPAVLELDGRDLDGPSTLFGVDLHAHGLGALERVGIAADGPRVRGQERLYCAGDVVAARPRTALEAARAGIAAARAACGKAHAS